MPNDASFRMAMLIGSAIFLPAMAFFRVRSQLTGERLDRRQEGMFILITLRLVAVVGSMVMICFLINPELVRWSSIPLPDWVRWCGIAVGGVAEVWVLWTFVYLGKNLTDTVVTRREHTLVVSGPYQWVRHPFYVGVAGIVAAAALGTANWMIAASGITILSLLIVRTDREEAKLIERFGEEYQAYMARTGRFWPRLRT